jgi:hypothetical protein
MGNKRDFTVGNALAGKKEGQKTQALKMITCRWSFALSFLASL